MDHNILVIGIGNRFRNDDGLGLVVAGKLKGRVPDNVEVAECADDGTNLVERWSGFTFVIAIDALSSGAPPGTIERIDLRTDAIPSEKFHCSTHAFGLSASVELARSLGTLPEQLVIYGIEGVDFAMGEVLSPVVRESADRVVSLIQNEIKSIVAPPHRGGKTVSAKPIKRYAHGERIP